MRPALIGVLLLIASPATAAEDEVVLAIEPAYALVTADVDLHGAGGHVTASYGLTDSVWLTASVGGSRQFGRKDIEGRSLLEAFAGITVAIDVFRTIPFVEVLIGAAGARIDGVTNIDPTVRLGGGFDFLLTPDISLGAVFRFRPVSDALGDSYLTADARLAWRVEL
jgi:hypothetical protein